MAKKPKESAQERALADVSRANWADYVERYRPAEAAWIKKAEFTKGEEARVKGEVAADAASAFKGLTRSTLASNAAAGAKIGSGKTKLGGLAQDALAKGTARGVGMAQAEMGGRLDSEQQKIAVAATGRDIAHEATVNMSRGAQRATNLALAASQAKFERNMALVEGAGVVAGTAFRKYQLKKEKDAFADSLLVPENRRRRTMMDEFPSVPEDPFDYINQFPLEYDGLGPLTGVLGKTKPPFKYPGT